MRNLVVVVTMVAVVMGFGVTVPASSATVPTVVNGDVSPVHDPTMVRSGSDWYLFSTGTAIPIRRSHDLAHWTVVGSVFPNGLPTWVFSALPELSPSSNVEWAPDVSFANHRWYLYYAVSVFGTSRSVIGLVTNATLDPADPNYRWVDQGKVLHTTAGSAMNAIDPNAVTDNSGHRWLAWGSFWDGIFVQRLDDATGQLEAGAPAFNLARRAPQWLGVEGASIVYRDGWWYLFVSFGSCCRGVHSSYSIHVGRSRALTGPYVDEADVPMTANGGSTVTGSYGNVVGPGHGTVLEDGGAWLLVHHFYDAAADGAATLSIQQLLWDPDGWPLAVDPGFVAATTITPATAAGVWHVTGYKEEYPPRVAVNVDVTLRADGVAYAGPAPPARLGTWRVAGNTIQVTGVLINGQPRDWWWWVDPTAEPLTAIGRNSVTAVVRGTRITDASPPSTSSTSTPASTSTTTSAAPMAKAKTNENIPPPPSDQVAEVAQPVTAPVTFTG